jgi:WXXGXW repeat (2 copies)
MESRKGNRIVKTKLIVLMLLATGAVFAQLSVGVRIGAPPPPRVVRMQPRSPGEGYAWVGGYWYPVGSRYKWHDGYWTRPAYTGARWVEPHHDGTRYFDGYWEGDHGQVAHDHRWDKDRSHNRDYNHDHDRQ